MSSPMLIKQFAFGRRRPGLTRQEYHDYRYKVHGLLSIGPTKEETPLRYYQTLFFDSAYNALETGRPGPKNFNHSWAFCDDATELYYSTSSHLLSVFGSEHVRTRVGPDAAHFADFGASNAFFCQEYDLPGFSGDGSAANEDGAEEGLVAVYFVEAAEYHDDGTEFMTQLSQPLIDAVEECKAQSAIKRVVVSARAPDSHGLLGYFGISPEMPKYAGAFMIYLRSADAVGLTRKVQKRFEDDLAPQGLLKVENMFIAFGKRMRVLDFSRGLGFDQDRQTENVIPKS